MRPISQQSQPDTLRVDTLDKGPLRACTCGLILGSATCPVCLKTHTWYHMTVATGAGWHDHYVTCDKYIKAEATTWHLVKDLSHRVEIVPDLEAQAISRFDRELTTMTLSPDMQAAVKALEETLPRLAETEETILQSSATILKDNSIPSVQRIQISNLFVNSSANIRNSITQLQQAIQAARQI